jgi:hypothetical protein
MFSTRDGVASYDPEPVLFTNYPHNLIRNTYQNFTFLIPILILISNLLLGVRVKVYHKTKGEPVDFRGSPPSLQENEKTVAQVRPQLLPSTALFIHDSLKILFLCALYSELLMLYPGLIPVENVS